MMGAGLPEPVIAIDRSIEIVQGLRGGAGASPLNVQWSTESHTMMNPATAEFPIRTLELAGYAGQFHDIVEDAGKLVSRLDTTQLLWSPEPGRWSITQCLDHLNVVAQRLHPVLNARISEAKERGLMAPGPFRHSMLGNFFIRMVEPPYKLKVPVPIDLVEAEEVKDPQEVLATFLHMKEQMLAMLVRADGLDLKAVTINSPFRRPLRLSLGQWFGFIAAHDRRHLWQAWNVRRDAKFPGHS